MTKDLDFSQFEEEKLRREFLGDYTLKSPLWREDPMPLDIFIRDSLREPPLTDIQYQDVMKVLGEDPKLIFTRRRPYQLGVFGWGKGSGKNYVISKVNTWVLHVIDCLFDPRATLLQAYTETDFVEVINIARNADQARDNFFSVLVNNIVKCEYFCDRYNIREGQKLVSSEGDAGTIVITRNKVKFPTGVRCISTHTDTQSVEGKNPIFFTFDEYSSFNLGKHGDILAKDIANKAFNNIESSAQSRFPDRWAGFVISYLRHEFTEETEPTVQLIKMGADSEYGIYGVVRSHWEVRTDRKYKEFFDFNLPGSEETIQVPTEFRKAFNRDHRDALARYVGVLPSSQIIDFFQDKSKIKECAVDNAPIVSYESVIMESGLAGKYYNGLNLYYDGRLLDFKSDVVIPANLASIPRSMHIDMSHKADRTALIMGHKDLEEKKRSKVVVDLILVWEADPIRGRIISVANVEAIVAILAKSFNVNKVTVDGWEPTEPERLARYGVECVRRKLKRDDFVNVRTLINSGSIIWRPFEFTSYNGDFYPDLLGYELGRLVDKGGKVEKAMNSTDDLADALTGMVAPLVDLEELREIARTSPQISVVNRGKGNKKKTQIISVPQGDQQKMYRKQPRGKIVGRR